MREMNKSLLGFRQRHVPSSPTDPIKTELEVEVGLSSRRLSPIGESFSSTPPETESEDKATSNNSKTGGRLLKICNLRNLFKPLDVYDFCFLQTSSPYVMSNTNWKTRLKYEVGLMVNR